MKGARWMGARRPRRYSKEPYFPRQVEMECWSFASEVRKARTQSAFDAEPQIHSAARCRNISRKGPRNCRSLGCARDDKGDGSASISPGCWLRLVEAG